MKKILSFSFLMLIAASSYAAGFRVALQSTRQLGMAHVGVGMQLGPESVFFNPGALSSAEKGGISVTGNAVLAKTEFNSPGSTYKAELENNVGTPFAVYGSFKFNDRFAGGIGVYTPFGNAVEWPDNWAGRAVSQKVDLSSIFIQPTLAYQVSDKVGLGAGFIYALGEVTLERGVPSVVGTNGEVDVELKTDGFASGIGFNAGMFIQAQEDLSFGVSYRSKIDVEAKDGKVSYTNVPTLASGSFQATSFDATLPLPAELSFGAGWEPGDRWTLGADLNYTFWSDYKELKFDYNDILGSGTQTVVPQEWSDAWAARLGAQYDATDKVLLRGGMYYDFTPIPDETLSPITPDADRFNVTGGISFLPNDKWSIDGSVLFVNGKERTVQASENQFAFGQRYRVRAIVPSFGFNYSFN